MAKQIRSVRVDEEITDVFTEYSALLQEMFGYTVSFSALVNEALAEYLMHSAERWVSAMESRSVVDPQPNGKMKRYDFTEEQIAKMEDIRNSIADVYEAHRRS